MLKRAFAAPLDVISLAGVMTGTCAFGELDAVHHLYGAKDVIEPLGPIMFASRWKIMRRSNWNRALAAGTVRIAHLGPVGHQVPGGLLDPALTLPDGRTALRQTLDHIHAVLVGSHDTDGVMPRAMRRLIIDTDTASDDAVALVMALAAPDVRIEAITVSCGNVPLELGRAECALYARAM